MDSLQPCFEANFVSFDLRSVFVVLLGSRATRLSLSLQKLQQLEA
jgi:hypothetical protein